MPYKRGQSGNIKGRKKGVKNRTDSQIRQALKDILNRNIDRLETAINGMDDKEAAKIIIQLARHYTFPETNPEKLSIEQLEQIVEYLKNQINEKQS